MRMRLGHLFLGRGFLVYDVTVWDLPRIAGLARATGYKVPIYCIMVERVFPVWKKIHIEHARRTWNISSIPSFLDLVKKRGFGLSTHFLIVWAVFFFLFLKWGSIKKKLADLILFEKEDPKEKKGDPRHISSWNLGFSKKIENILLYQENIYTLNTLIIKVVYYRNQFLEIEGLDQREKARIIHFIISFIHNSWALEGLFDSSFEKLRLRPWWIRLLISFFRKMKDPAFMFISELGLSNRIESFLIKEKIYTIEDMIKLLKDFLIKERIYTIEHLIEILKDPPQSSRWGRFPLVDSKDLRDMDLINLYTNLYNFLCSMYI